MNVAVCRLSLYFAGSSSLKDKRQGLRRIVDRVRAKFNVAIAEVAYQDTWQRSTLALAAVSNDGGHARAMVESVVGFVESLYVAQILDQQVEVLHYDDDGALS